MLSIKVNTDYQCQYYKLAIIIVADKGSNMLEKLDECHQDRLAANVLTRDKG